MTRRCAHARTRTQSRFSQALKKWINRYSEKVDKSVIKKWINRSEKVDKSVSKKWINRHLTSAQRSRQWPVPSLAQRSV